MPQKRSKDQIIAQTLDLCQGESANKTRIVYQVNLNSRNAEMYLDLLLERGFLEAIEGDRITYKTTSAGERVLESLRKVEAIYS